jgi:hypothetical protein
MVTDELQSSVFLVDASWGVRTGVGLHDHHTVAASDNRKARLRMLAQLLLHHFCHNFH